MSGVRARYTGNRLDKAELARLFTDGDGPAGKDLDRRARRVLTAAREGVRVRTGTLLASGRRSSGRGATGIYQDITFGRAGLTHYLGYNLFGADPHVIRPRRRRALRFISRSGALVFATQVNHPGNRGHNFLVEALDAARG